jgi:predicted PolB exonuclease-like 3'-5' exonuclease
MLNGRRTPSLFDIPCSVFDIQSFPFVKGGKKLLPFNKGEVEGIYGNCQRKQTTEKGGKDEEAP